MKLADLLNELEAEVRRYVVLTAEQAAAVVLWMAHTHVFEAFDVAPYLAVTSAEKRSGKSRLLDVLALFVARPWRVISPTEAVVFRKVERDRPTLLLDEVDAIFGSGPAAAQHEGLRALLNAGNRRGTRVPRCVGQSYTLVEFSVFCPKALAGIGALPETVADRAISIRLRRKAAGEDAERFRERDAIAEAAPLATALVEWGADAVDELATSRPALPLELHDRAADSWEPLLAIADLAGNEWPQRAREAAVELAHDEAPETMSYGVRLLADIFAALSGADRIRSADLIATLVGDEEAPWATYRGGGLNPMGLAALLRPYGIKPATLRFGDATAKGYLRSDFQDVWPRYLPTNPSRREHPSQAAGHAAPEDTSPSAVTGRKVDSVLRSLDELLLRQRGDE